LGNRAGHAPPFPQHEGMSLEITEELIARQTPEAQAIIRALLAKIQELQDRLNQSPRNSSSPPLRLTLRVSVHELRWHSYRDASHDE